MLHYKQEGLGLRKLPAAASCKHRSVYCKPFHFHTVLSKKHRAKIGDLQRAPVKVLKTPSKEESYTVTEWPVQSTVRK